MRKVIVMLIAVTYCLFGCPEWIAGTSLPLWARAFAHPFFHGNVFHLAVNMIALWYAFPSGRRDNIRTFAAALVIAALSFAVVSEPAIGMSNVVYAAIGLRSPEFSHRWWKSPQVKAFLIVTAAMAAIPMFSTATHLISFAAGILISVSRRFLTRTFNDARRYLG